MQTDTVHIKMLSNCHEILHTEKAKLNRVKVCAGQSSCEDNLVMGVKISLLHLSVCSTSSLSVVI